MRACGWSWVTVTFFSLIYKSLASWHIKKDGKEKGKEKENYACDANPNPIQQLSGWVTPRGFILSRVSQLQCPGTSSTQDTVRKSYRDIKPILKLPPWCRGWILLRGTERRKRAQSCPVPRAALAGSEPGSQQPRHEGLCCSPWRMKQDHFSSFCTPPLEPKERGRAPLCSAGSGKQGEDRSEPLEAPPASAAQATEHPLDSTNFGS